MDKMEELFNLEVKVVKIRRGKRKISEIFSRDENEYQKFSKKSVVEEVIQFYMEDNEVDEIVIEIEIFKKIRGRKSLVKLENVYIGRRGVKKSDKEKIEDDSE